MFYELIHASQALLFVIYTLHGPEYWGNIQDTRISSWATSHSLCNDLISHSLWKKPDWTYTGVFGGIGALTAVVIAITMG
jgi:hypothetical protein